MHGYYQVMLIAHQQSGSLDFTEKVSYNDFRCSWYSFLQLLDISLENNASCSICGPSPEVVICDATGLGHQRKFLALGLTEGDESLSNPRTSYELPLISMLALRQSDVSQIEINHYEFPILYLIRCLGEIKLRSSIMSFTCRLSKQDLSVLPQGFQGKNSST